MPIERPSDYFAEMVKSDEHMEYIRLKLAKQKRRLERIDEKKRETELKVSRNTQKTRSYRVAIACGCLCDSRFLTLKNHRNSAKRNSVKRSRRS